MSGDEAEGSAAPSRSATTLGKRRFQFTILQLTLFVLSIGAMGAFWTIGCTSLALPVVLAWLWWSARGRGLWGYAGLTFGVSSVLLIAGQYWARRSVLPFNAERSVALDWTLLAREWQRSLEDWLIGPSPDDVIRVTSEPSLLTLSVWGEELVVEKVLSSPWRNQYGEQIQKPLPRRFSIRLPESLRVELLDLLDQHGFFLMDEEMYVLAITHNARSISLQRGAFSFRVWTSSYV